MQCCGTCKHMAATDMQHGELVESSCDHPTIRELRQYQHVPDWIIDKNVFSPYRDGKTCSAYEEKVRQIVNQELVDALKDTYDMMNILAGLAWTGSRIPVERYPEYEQYQRVQEHTRTLLKTHELIKKLEGS